jgi:hypothetical protein
VPQETPEEDAALAAEGMHIVEIKLPLGPKPFADRRRV